eukprot:scaffold16953_cov79-Skeletonema_dohrnii-CCMP3373.AAC.2
MDAPPSFSHGTDFVFRPEARGYKATQTTINFIPYLSLLRKCFLCHPTKSEVKKYGKADGDFSM